MPILVLLLTFWRWQPKLSWLQLRPLTSHHSCGSGGSGLCFLFATTRLRAGTLLPHRLLSSLLAKQIRLVQFLLTDHVFQGSDPMERADPSTSPILVSNCGAQAGRLTALNPEIRSRFARCLHVHPTYCTQLFVSPHVFAFLLFPGVRKGLDAKAPTAITSAARAARRGGTSGLADRAVPSGGRPGPARPGELPVPR